MKSTSFIGINITRPEGVRGHEEASIKLVTRYQRLLGLVVLGLSCGLVSIAQQSDQTVSGFQRSLNLTACGYGIGQCDERLLSASEVVQVGVIRHRMNVQACGYGIGRCDESLLSPSEVVQVGVIRHRMNIQACGYGIGQCDERLLSSSEAAQVSVIRHRMNSQACGYGIGKCNQAKLTPPEPAVVRATGDVDECLASSFLSPRMMASSAAVPTAPDTQLDELFKALLTSAGAPAENGSYYGEPNKNGVPKTILVNGYTRSNGTYVRGYYRSAPGTNR